MSNTHWPKEGQIWKHTVRQSIYRVKGVYLRQAKDDSDGQFDVVYEPLDKNMHGYQRNERPEWLHDAQGCTRPLMEWLEIVDLPDGSQALRFERVR